MTVDIFSPPEGDVDPGVIIPWYDRNESIPPGWMLCDGNNGTPDLRNRFPRCVPDSSTDPGARGGSNSISLSTSQLSSHGHNASTSNDGEHNHTITVGTTVDHEGFFNSEVGGPNSVTTESGGAHGHSASLNNTGGNGNYDNRPLHEAVNFVQKA